MVVESSREKFGEYHGEFGEYDGEVGLHQTGQSQDELVRLKRANRLTSHALKPRLELLVNIFQGPSAAGEVPKHRRIGGVALPPSALCQFYIVQGYLEGVHMVHGVLVGVQPHQNRGLVSEVWAALWRPSE